MVCSKNADATFECITGSNNDPLKHNFDVENTIFGLTRAIKRSNKKKNISKNAFPYQD